LESLESDLEKEKKKAAKSLETAKAQQESETAELKKTIETLRSDLNSAKQKSNKDIQSAKGQQKSETGDLKKTIETLRADLDKAQQKAAQELKNANEEFSSKLSALETRTADAERKTQEVESQAHKATQNLKDAQAKLEQAQSEAKEKEEARQATQSELDDLLIVFGDLEAKRTEDKVWLLSSHVENCLTSSSNDSRILAKIFQRMRMMMKTMKRMKTSRWFCVQSVYSETRPVNFKLPFLPVPEHYFTCVYHYKPRIFAILCELWYLCSDRL
jgi:chromosome segregation ATPase